MLKKEIPVNFSLPNKKAYLIISIISILLYSNTLKHGFVLDDTAVIENNRFVKDGVSGIPKLLNTFYWEGYWESNAGLYSPLSLITFAVEYELSLGNPLIHHFVNVLLYVLICCLLYRFFSSLFDKINPWFFLFATLMFATNPLHTEVIANIKSRDEILSLLFFLLCCDYLYLRFGAGRMKMILLSSSFFLLSLLSKEGAVIFLPLIFLFDYLKEKEIMKILRDRLHLIITTVIWFLWHRYVIQSSGDKVIEYTRNDNSLIDAAFWEQKATALGMFARYIFKLIYPYQLSYDYSFNQIPVINLFSPLAILGIMLLGSLIYVAVRYFKSDIFITICIAFILLPLFLTGNLFFNIGATMADRFLFIPTIGSSLLVSLLIFKVLKTDLSKNFDTRKLCYLFIPILIIFSIKAYSRNSNWKSNATLFAEDVNTVPGSARAHYNYGTALMNNKYRTQNFTSEAQKEFETCLSINPNYLDAIINLGAVYTSQKNYLPAIQNYRKGLALDPLNNTLYGNMGEAFYRNAQPDSAAFYLDKAQKLGNRLPGVYLIQGIIKFEKKEYVKASEVFEKGIAIDSTSWNLYMNYGNALAVSGRKEAALKAFEKARTLNKDNARILYFMALTYRDMGDTLHANEYYDAYLRNKK